MSPVFAEIFRYTSVHICHAVTLCLMTDCRYSRRTCRLVWAAAGGGWAVLAVFVYLLPQSGITTGIFVAASFLSAVTYGVVYAHLAKRPWQRALFLVSTYITVFLFALGFSICLSTLFFGGSHMAITVLRTVFFVIYDLLLVWKLRPAFLRISAEITRGWGTMAALAVFTCAVIFTAGACFLIMGVGPLRWLISLGLLLALVVAEYMAILRMMDLLSRQSALRSEESQRKLLESQLAAEQEFVALANAHRHDTRHHAALLADYLEREDLAGMREYLSQYIAELDGEALEHYCENTVADALLRLTARRCREGNISCAIQAVIPETLSLTGPELAAVLGNILENAWEAAKGAQSPRLRVTAQQKGGSLLVEVENTLSGSSRFEGELPLTTKAGGGQGLKSVQRTLERHGGMLQCSRQGDTFYTQVVIPL